MFLVGINMVRIWYARPLPANFTIGPSQNTVAFILVGIALMADIIIPFSPNSIQFVLKVLSDLKFGAIVIFLYSRHSLRWLVISVLAAFTLLRSRNMGMFHESLLWAALFTIYAFYRYADPRKPIAVFSAKVAVAIFGTLAIISLQLVKSEFRAALYRGDNISLVRMSLEKALDFEQMTDPEALANVLVRFNQGWIISRILDNIPSREPYNTVSLSRLQQKRLSCRASCFQVAHRSKSPDAFTSSPVCESTIRPAWESASLERPTVILDAGAARLLW